MGSSLVSREAFEYFNTTEDTNAFKVLVFIKLFDMPNIEWLMDFHAPGKIFFVVDWKEEGSVANKALLIDLRCMNAPGRNFDGEQIYIPFPWAEEKSPTPLEAILCVKTACVLQQLYNTR